jgi:hypothetical protein
MKDVNMTADDSERELVEINYYIFDRIEQQADGSYQAYLDDKSCEVFPLDEDDEQTLIAKGFAKCDAPGTETFVVEETNLQENADGKIEIVD